MYEIITNISYQLKEITFFDPDAWRDIHGYGTKESRKSIGSVPPKHWPFYPKSVNGVEPIITDEDIDEHARARRIFAPAFSDRALTKQAPLFTKYADKLVNKLREGNTDGNKWDIVRMYNYTTFDVMADLTFGESMHMLENAEVSQIFHFRTDTNCIQVRSMGKDHVVSWIDP